MTSVPIQLPQAPEAKKQTLSPGFLKKGMRLAQFKPGQVWMIKHPRRVVSIVEENTVELRDADGVMRVYPCLVCVARIPTAEIPGHVSAHDVAANKLILAGVQTQDATDGHDSGPNQSWKEIWAERQYPGVVMSKGFPAPRVEDGEKAPRYPFATVVHVQGRSEKRENTSPIQGSRPAGDLLSPDIVSPAVFGEQEDASEEPSTAAEDIRHEGGEVGAEAPLRQSGEAAEASAQEAEALPVKYMALMKLAKERGVDISDIKGKGAVARIQERLSA